MKLKPFGELVWNEILANNYGEPYGASINAFADAWASESERLIEEAINPVEAVRRALDNTLQEIDVSGFQFNIASQILVSLWTQGDSLKAYLDEIGGTFEAPTWDIPENGRRINSNEFDFLTPASTPNDLVVVDEHVYLDLNQPLFNDAFDAACTKPFQKSIPVKAVQVHDHEKIQTVVDGSIEAENETSPTDWVITNPGGEQYVVPDERFRNLYESIGNDRYIAATKRLLIHNPTGYPVAVQTPWDKNSLMFGDRHSLFVADCIEDGKIRRPGSERYIIARSEATITYGKMLVSYQALQVQN